MDMFRRMFGATGGAGGSNATPNTLATLEKLNEAKEMLTKKEALLQKKMAAEVERAKEYMRANNKRAALQCLKKKKMYQTQADQILNNILRLEEQTITLEGAKSTMEMLAAMKQGASAMKQQLKDTNIGDVDKTLDEITEQTEKHKEIQEALGTPIGLAADIDDDELDRELEELEAADLDEALLAPGIPAQPLAAGPAGPIRAAALPAAPARPLPTAPAGAAPATRAPAARAPPARSTEDDELEALQAEMAM